MNNDEIDVKSTNMNESINETENTDTDMLKDENQKLQESYTRLLAELVNMKRNAQLDKQKSKQGLILKIINIIDTYSLVLQNSQDQNNDLLDTLKNILQQLEIMIATESVTKVTLQKGDSFDPTRAEVITTVPGEENGKIVEVISPGYEMDGTIIKTAKIIVSKQVV